MLLTKEIKVPWLLSPKWKDFPMTKGLDHHRVPMGFILAADEQIKCTLGSSRHVDRVRVRLFSDDSDREDQYVVNRSMLRRGAVIRSSTVSVPFVDCEYLDDIPEHNQVFKVEFPSTSKVLPTFHYGDDEVAFFDEWDSVQAEYAYIESDYFALLIPEIDKENVRNLPKNQHLDDLILFYDEIFTIYSGLIGLSFEKSGLNENVRNRFFLKADKNGVGAAYYCDWCSAESSESVTKFWLDLSPTNWGALHEIAHGHELQNLSDETFSTNEVWNNILVVFYQYFMLGKNILTEGGLSRKQMLIGTHLKSGEPVKDWGLFQKLSFLLHMFFRSGPKAFTRFNELTRKHCAGNLSYVSGVTILEKLMHLFATDFGLDMFPYMKLANAAISEAQLLEHYHTFAEVAYPVNYLIKDPSLNQNLKNKLNLLFDTSLVTPLDLRSSNLKNNLTLEIDGALFPILFGQVLKIMDGYRTLFEKRIVRTKFHFKNVPIGVYKIFVPLNFLSLQYFFNENYVVVNAKNPTNFKISANIFESSILLQDKIKFLGLSNEHFATLSIDVFKCKVKFNIFCKDPHSYFDKRMYASVKIKTFENETIFEKTMEGTNCTIDCYEIPLEDILIVEIFHAETEERLKLEDPSTCGVINPKSNTNILFASKLGFQNQYTSKKILAEKLLKRIDSVALRIRNLNFLYERTYCYPKYNLFLAIESYTKLFGDISPKLEALYRDCLPPEFSTDNVDALVNFSKSSVLKLLMDDYFYVIFHTESGKAHILPRNESSFLSVKMKFFGYCDKHVASLSIDTQRGLIVFHVLHSNPHHRFRKETYYHVMTRNRRGDTTFSKSIEGIDSFVGTFEIPVHHYAELVIYHAESSDRLKIENPATKYIVNGSNNTNAFIIHKQRLKRNQRLTDTFKKCFHRRKKMLLKKSTSLDTLNYGSEE